MMDSVTIDVDSNDYDLEDQGNSSKNTKYPKFIDRKLSKRKAESIIFNKIEDNANKSKFKAHHKNMETTDEVLSNCDDEFLSNAEKIMFKMGYKKGKGLGKNLEGIHEPIATSTQKGRRGLGLKLKELEDACVQFSPDKELINIDEKLVWFENKHKTELKFTDLSQWLKEKEKPNSAIEESYFCDPRIVNGIMSAKSVFDRLDKNEMLDARTRSNPFETIKNVFFLNRAAVKMANIDKVSNYMFTNPSDLESNELLYFADVCAGPGGFSEYIFWKKKWRAKGFGFTLRNENDFKLHEFYAGPSETFHPYYGPLNNGDIYQPENQMGLLELILSQTNQKGVHFMMSDGGFSYEGQENLQEYLSKQLYLCQCLVALMIIRPRGHFVTKLFDIFTPFSVGLVYLISTCFDCVSIFKPNTSRPANSERYLICKNKHSNVDDVIKYLRIINEKLLIKDNSKDIFEIVPLTKLLLDKEFFNYVKSSNEIIGQNQIIALQKIAAYAEDKNLIETRQKILREKFLINLELPDQLRIHPRNTSPGFHAQKLLKDTSIYKKIQNEEVKKLTKENVSKTFTSHLDWRFQVSFQEDIYNQHVNEATFYLGQGRNKVFRYNVTQKIWEQVNNYGEIELPADTLVYAEIVQEFRQESKRQTKIFALHILDACFLGSEDISEKHFMERHTLLQIFVEALWKPLNKKYIPVRVKEVFSLNLELQQQLKLQQRSMKNGLKLLGYYPISNDYENESEPYYCIPRNIIFFKIIDDPWACHFSTKHEKYYYYNKVDKESRWELPNASINFIKLINTRMLWKWPYDKELTLAELTNYLRNSPK